MGFFISENQEVKKMALIACSKQYTQKTVDCRGWDTGDRPPSPVIQRKRDTPIPPAYAFPFQLGSLIEARAVHQPFR